MDHDSSSSRQARLHQELVERLVQWKYLGGSDTDVEWGLLQNLSPAEKAGVEAELERLSRTIDALLEALTVGKDDIFGS